MISEGKQAAGVVIVSADWQSRALLRAQLLEEGCEVRAFESAADAERVLRRNASVMKGRGSARLVEGDFKLRLIVADLSAGGSASEIERLAQLAQCRAVWVLASRSSAAETEWNTCGFERVLFRPIDMRDLVEAIKHRLGSCTH